MEKEPVFLQVYTDYLCPWCYLADYILEAVSKKYPLKINYIGYEIHPHISPDGEAVTTLSTVHEDVNEFGKPYGLKVAPITWLPNSHKALIVGEYAKLKGKDVPYIRAMHRMACAEGKNIGDREVIYDAALEAGIERVEVDTVLSELKWDVALACNRMIAGQQRIDTVPTIIFPDGYQMKGLQDEEILENTLINRHYIK